MSFDRASQSKQKSAPTIIPASRLRARRDFELPQYPHPQQRATGLGHDFSRMAVNKPFPTGQACPLSIAGPRACPFGGACHTCPSKIQAKLAISQPGDEYEQEADRVAETVMQGHPGAMPAVTRSAPPILQRQAEIKPKSEDEKYAAAAEKVGEAFLETDLGKKLKAEAARLGKAFIGSLAGKIITGAAAVGTVTTLAATHGELPIQVPEIPLDALMPGMKVKLTYKGPVDRPTEAAISFSFTLGAGKEAEKKPALTEKEKYRAETARMAAEQEKFREGLKSPEQRAREKELFERAFWSTRTPLGLEPIKIPGLTLEPRPAARPPKKEEETLRRKAEGGSVQHTPQAIPPIVHEVLRSPGQPLDQDTRAFMEPRFGHDFSRVRVHHDEAAAASARAVNALAYTMGHEIIFNTGQYQPDGLKGRLLIAHELAHSIQQETAYTTGIGEDTWLEQVADKAAISTVFNTNVKVPATTIAPAIQFVRISSGALGKAVEAFTLQWSVPDKAIWLLRKSPTFMKLVAVLDQNYVWRGDSYKVDPSPETDASGRIRKGPFKGKRELFDVIFGKPSFEPIEAPPEPGKIKLSGDIIQIESTDIPGFIQELAHEATHAANFVGTSAPPPQTIVDEVEAGIKDEIAARKSEAKILKEIPSKEVQARTATVASAVPAEVERDISPAFGLTYLEQFFFARRLREAQAADALADEEAENMRDTVEKEIKANPARTVPLFFKPRPDPSGILTLSQYGDIWFFRRLAQREWEDFSQKNKPGDPDYETEKEKVLMDHSKRFFEGKITYRPL
jgi:Domain of unknown function (DUF4157)